jgi:hypothetical protein
MVREPDDQIVSGSSGGIPIWSTLKIAPHHLSQDQVLPEPIGVLCFGASTSQQMEGKEHDAQNEGDVNEPSGNVKCEKSEQPENNQNRSD